MQFSQGPLGKNQKAKQAKQSQYAYVCSANRQLCFCFYGKEFVNGVWGESRKSLY
jgi:hypothetical protein